jgi:hypothetical protein
MDIKSDGFKSYTSSDYFVEATEAKMSVNVPFVYDEQFIGAYVYQYTSPSSWPNITINSSFITYYVGGSSSFLPIPAGSSGYSYNVTKSLPDGTYYGQRLTLRLVVLPFRMTYGGNTYQYTGTVYIDASMVSGLMTYVATATCSAFGGQEQLVDLVWTGRTLKSDYGATTWEVLGGWRVIGVETTNAVTV